MKIEEYQVISVVDRPDLDNVIQVMVEAVWPLYIIHATVRDFSEYTPDWFGIYQRWPQFQFGLFDGQGEMVACGNALAFPWDGDAASLPDTGWDWLMHRAEQDHAAGRAPNTLAALSASIPPAHRAKGLSSILLRAMRRLAQAAELTHMIVPVRPNLKVRYPIIPIEDYITWTNEEGLPFDPWIRTHVRLGARVLKPCPRSMTMGGRVAQWEEWTGVPIPGSGQFVLPDLLAPLQVDHEADRCVYVEPNVWMEHTL